MSDTKNNYHSMLTGTHFILETALNQFEVVSDNIGKQGKIE